MNVVCIGVGVYATVCTGTELCDVSPETGTGDEEGETTNEEETDVSTRDEEELFLFSSITVGVVAIFLVVTVLDDDDVETGSILARARHEERKCPLLLLGTMMSESRKRKRLLSVRPRAAAVA